MKKVLPILLITLISGTGLHAQLLPIYGGERAGLSALNFLKNDLNPRSMGTGGASVALDGDVYSILSNPAALSDLEHNSFAVSHLFLNAGVHQSFVTGVFRLKDQVSHLGISLNNLSSGEMEERTEFQPLGTGRTIFLNNLAVGLTYSRQLSALFSAAVTVKYVYEGVAEYSNHAATVDVGFLYRTDFRDLQFAVMIQNFGGNSSLSNDGQELPVLFSRNTSTGLDPNTVPTVFKLGASMKPYKDDKQSLLVAVELQHPNDNAENYRLGVEYELMDLFFARIGYKINVKDQDYPTFGMGIRARLGGWPFYIDYAATPTNFMGIQNSIGLRVDILNNTRE